MFTRTTGWLIVPLWLGAMSWLVVHDVVPAWTAQEPPALEATKWLKEHGTRSQFAIQNESGRLGTMWTKYMIDPLSIQRTDLIWIERFPLPVAPLRMIVDSVFTADGLLDEITIRLDNADTRMRLHGERFHNDFSFLFEMGPDPKRERVYKVPLIEGGIIAGAINPFAQLSGLKVGQRWRMQIFNPLAVLTGLGDRFRSILVEVTGQARCDSDEGPVDCFVVEAAGAKAWIDPHGAVRVQEAVLPLVGKLRLVRESAFDEQARLEIRRKWLLQSIGMRR